MKYKFCVLDTETWGLDAQQKSFALCCVYGDNGNFKKHFTDREKLVEWIFTQKEYTHIFAHNSEYDLTTIFGNIYQKLDRSALFVGSLLICAKKDGVTFANSFAILRSSVAELGKNSNNQKLELADKFKSYTKGDKKIINEHDITYCYRDCEIVYDYLFSIFEMTGKIVLTIASAAMTIYKNEFSEKEYKYKKITECFRQSYYGGRVEVFRFGNYKNIKKYDINSLYPFVCVGLNYPNPNFLVHTKKIIKSKFDYDLKMKEGVAFVIVNVFNNYYGCLPFSREKELIYPIGKIEGWYNFNELRFCLDKKLLEILEVKEYYAAPKMRLFGLETYVKKFFKEKNETVGAEKLINKYLLNALTGKFSQKQHPDRHYFENEKMCFDFVKKNKIPLKNIEIKHFNSERSDCFLEVKNSEKRIATFVAPFISSYITSAARMVMLPFFERHKKSLIYTDTDSLVLLNEKINKKYISNDFGSFKKEDETEITVYGNKNYLAVSPKKETRYHKGVPRINKCVDGVYFFKKMIKTKEAIKRNLNAGEFVDIQKRDVKKYTKRIVSRDGTTKPIIL